MSEVFAGIQENFVFGGHKIRNFITHFRQKLLNTHTKLLRKNMVGHRELLLKTKEQKTDDPPFSSSKKLWPPLSAHQKSHDPHPYSIPVRIQLCSNFCILIALSLEPNNV